MNQLNTIRVRPLTPEERSRTWETIAARVSSTSALSPFAFPFRTAISLAAVFIFLVGTVTASDSARPGQILFPLDTAVERVESALNASSHVDHAQERLAEFDYIAGNTIAQETVAADMRMEKDAAPETMMMFSMEQPAQAILSEETEEAIAATRNELHKILNRAALENDTETLANIMATIDEFEMRVNMMRGQ